MMVYDIIRENENKNNENHHGDNDNANDNDSERWIVKICDFGLAQYFGNENLIQLNKTYNVRKDRTIRSCKTTIDDLNEKITKVRKSMQLPAEVKTDVDYDRIRGNLSLIHPTFKNFQKYYKINNGAKQKGDSIFTYNRFSIGKEYCMAPEVMYKVSDDGEFTKKRNGEYAKAESKEDQYDARKADIWSLGVVLFFMCTGLKLYEHPNPDDVGFKFAFEGNLGSYKIEIQVERRKKKVACKTIIPGVVLDLLEKIFKPAKYRIAMDELLQHPRLGLCICGFDICLLNGCLCCFCNCQVKEIS